MWPTSSEHCPIPMASPVRWKVDSLNGWVWGRGPSLGMLETSKSLELKGKWNSSNDWKPEGIGIIEILDASKSLELLSNLKGIPSPSGTEGLLNYVKLLHGG